MSQITFSFYYLADLSAVSLFTPSGDPAAVFCPLGLLPLALGAPVAALALVLRWTGRPLLTLGALLLWAALPLFSPLSGTEVEALHAFSLPVGLVLARYLPPETGQRRINWFTFPVAPSSVPAVPPRPLVFTNVGFMLTAQMVAAYLVFTPTLLLRFIALFLDVRVRKHGTTCLIAIPQQFLFFVYVFIALLGTLGREVQYTLHYHPTYNYYWFEFSEGVLWQLAYSGVAADWHYEAFRKTSVVQVPKARRNPHGWRNYDTIYRTNRYYSDGFVAIFGQGAGLRDGVLWTSFPTYPIIVSLTPRRRRR